MRRPPRLAWVAWIAVCLIWGTTYLGIRIALESIPPAVMAALRWTAAGSIVSVIVRARGGRLPGPAAWPSLAVLGLLMIACGNGFVVYAEQYVPSGLTAVVLATSPFWMVVDRGAAAVGRAPGRRRGRGPARRVRGHRAARVARPARGGVRARPVRRRRWSRCSWRARAGRPGRRTASATARTMSSARRRCRCSSAAC